MQNLKLTIALCTLISMAAVPESRAQMLKWNDHGFININGGVQTRSQEFTETLTPVIYGETASFSTPHKIDGGVLFDIGGGVRVWSNLGIGMAYSQFSKTESPTVTAQVPNPLFFDRPRTASTSAAELEHRESVAHLHALWMLPASDRIDVALSAGPSFFRVNQDLVSGDITSRVVEGGAPFSSVTISEVPIVRQKKTGMGFNVGADVSYLVTRQIGAGVFIRYSAATVELPLAEGGTTSMDVGGFQIGAGARVRF